MVSTIQLLLVHDSSGNEMKQYGVPLVSQACLRLIVTEKSPSCRATLDWCPDSVSDDEMTIDDQIRTLKISGCSSPGMSVVDGTHLVEELEYDCRSTSLVIEQDLGIGKIDESSDSDCFETELPPSTSYLRYESDKASDSDFCSKHEKHQTSSSARMALEGPAMPEWPRKHRRPVGGKSASKSPMCIDLTSPEPQMSGPSTNLNNNHGTVIDLFDSP